MNREERNKILAASYWEWMRYAREQEEMPFEVALAEYYNYHRKGMYLICESPFDGSTRLFIKDVIDSFWDNKDEPYSNWSKVFTYTNEPTKKGLSICKIDYYRTDNKGYLNLKVTSLKPIENYKYYNAFAPQFEGSFRSQTWWYLFNQTTKFLPGYHFSAEYPHAPNISNVSNLISDEFYGAPARTIANEVLRKFIAGEISYDDIESHITELPPWDKFVDTVTDHIKHDKLDSEYGDTYPELTKKLQTNFGSKSNNLDMFGFWNDVNNYLSRQNGYYWQLVEQEVFPMGEALSIPGRIEKALQYRKVLKEKEKEEKKLKRKAAKATV